MSKNGLSSTLLNITLDIDRNRKDSRTSIISKAMHPQTRNSSSNKIKNISNLTTVLGKKIPNSQCRMSVIEESHKILSTKTYLKTNTVKDNMELTLGMNQKHLNICNETIKETENETNMEEESRRGSAVIPDSTVKSDKEIRLNIDHDSESEHNVIETKKEQQDSISESCSSNHSSISSCSSTESKVSAHPEFCFEIHVNGVKETEIKTNNEHEEGQQTEEEK